MKNLLNATSVVALTAAMSVSVVAEENDIEEVVVVAYPVMVANTASPVEAAPAADGADFLRAIPGVSAGRFGGHSLEPFIRGMSQSQLSVRNDGSLQIGSGPNRMDTPSTYATIDLIDKVTVHRGFQSVLNGPDAVGGVILYERDIPTYEDTLWSHAKVGASYESNGDVQRAFGRASVGKGNLAVEGWYSVHDADNYHDGEGKEVRSAFHDKAAGVAVTMLNQDGAYLQASYSWNKMTDSLFPGAGMDSVLTGGDTLILKGVLPVDDSWIEELRLTSSYAATEHVMNNFAHRMTMGMLSEATTNSTTYNAEVEMDFALGGETATLAANYRDITNDGVRLSGMMPSMVNKSTTIMWPDINRRQYGLALEQKREIASSVNLTLGMRSDWTDVSFSKADLRADMGMMGMMPMTANMMYKAYYGYMASDVSEHLLSGLAKVDWNVSEGLNLHAGISRSGRTADATERGFANLMMMNGKNSSWVGNPALKPEKHTQMEVGFLKSTDTWSIGLSAYVNKVDDYILRDSARGQDGILMTAPMADVYRNINATLVGFEMQAHVKLSDYISLNGDMSYTRGTDNDRDAPLSQIPPLQGNLSVAYQQSAYQLSANLRYGMKQTRVDLNPMMGTGRDAGETPSYAVIDVIGGYKVSESVKLQAGVRNLLDKQFADHLSRSNLLDATEVQVNEPGRSLFVKLVAEF